MSYLESLPAGYRFTAEDEEKHWEIFFKYFDGSPLSEEEENFYAIVDFAERLKCELGFWPTKETVEAELEKRQWFGPKKQK